ncbi:energy-coupling factor transporter transmembrane protein EcfT [bacterium]|nr:energy-coupling factor transporter transmembrane protein EcfT [bacterium]
MKNISLGKYIPGDSIIHKMDPRSKVVSFFVIILFFILFNRIVSHIAGFVILLLIMFIAGLSMKNLLGLLKTFRLFFYITFLVHLLFTEGEGGYSWLWFNVSFHGAYNGLLFSLRLFLLLFSGALLTWTTQPMEFTNSLEKMLSPLKLFKVPVRDFSLMMMIALRFIPTMLDEIEITKRAQMARGAKFEGGLFKKIKSLVPLIIPLFAQSFRRAETLALALEARAYTSDHERTYYKPLHFNAFDWVVTLGSCFCLLFFLYVKMFI